MIERQLEYDLLEDAIKSRSDIIMILCTANDVNMIECKGKTNPNKKNKNKKQKQNNKQQQKKKKKQKQKNKRRLFEN